MSSEFQTCVENYKFAIIYDPLITGEWSMITQDGISHGQNVAFLWDIERFCDQVSMILSRWYEIIIDLSLQENPRHSISMRVQLTLNTHKTKPHHATTQHHNSHK